MSASIRDGSIALSGPSSTSMREAMNRRPCKELRVRSALRRQHGCLGHRVQRAAQDAERIWSRVAALLRRYHAARLERGAEGSAEQAGFGAGKFEVAGADGTQSGPGVVGRRQVRRQPRQFGLHRYRNGCQRRRTDRLQKNLAAGEMAIRRVRNHPSSTRCLAQGHGVGSTGTGKLDACIH